MDRERTFKTIDRINEAHRARKVIAVNGQRVKGYGNNDVVRLWGTGRISVDVKARTSIGVNQLWFDDVDALEKACEVAE